MQVSVVYVEPKQQHWLEIKVDDASSVRSAIDASGILKLCPHIDLTQQRVGIYGKQVKLDATLREGDRVEIYRPIMCDPLTIARRDRLGDEETEAE